MKSKFLIVFSLFACALNAQTIADKKVTWDYPVKPGMEKWKEFNLTVEMVNACQIPEAVLSKLSTDDLTEICLQYPLFICVYAVNVLNNGVENLYNEFNGIRELYSRKDAASCLIKRYIQKVQSFSFLDEEHSDYTKGAFMNSATNLEILLSQIAQYDTENCKEILKCLVYGYEEKLKYKNYFGYGFVTNFYSRAQVIRKMDNTFIDALPDKELNPIISSGRSDEKTFSLIDEISYKLIK